MVPDVRRTLVPDTWTADGEGALPKLGPYPHDNSCIGCRGTEMATSRYFSAEFEDIAEVYTGISVYGVKPTIYFVQFYCIDAHFL